LSLRRISLQEQKTLTGVRARVCRGGPCRRLPPPPPAPPSPPPPPARGRSPAHGSRQPPSHGTGKQTVQINGQLLNYQRIYYCTGSVSDPYSFDTDPDPTFVFDVAKQEKIISAVAGYRTTY
jgi:hypothetical protein